MNARRSTKRRWRFLAAIGCASLVGLQVLAHAERRPAQVLDAEQERKTKQINTQLDEILAVQEAILQRYDELMEELRIVKVRASQ